MEVVSGDMASEGATGVQQRQSGYDWMPDRFGPPPGIPRWRKEQLDRMSEADYFYALQQLSPEEKESLMVSERERRRSFALFWPKETIVKVNDCAKEGFYYTGVADKVQCVFCGGIAMDWERGDKPEDRHKNSFIYCKIFQDEPNQNIPISDSNGGSRSRNVEANGSDNSCSRGMCDELASPSARNRPRPGGRIEVFGDRGRRMETYRRYPPDSVIPADDLCDAGFYYLGSDDKVKCFWCKGELSGWERGDDPWITHAKMFPGCTWLQTIRGLEYIRDARAQMIPAERTFAQTAYYEGGDLSFLDQPPAQFVLPNQPVRRYP